MQGWHYGKGRILACNKSALCHRASPAFSFVVKNDLLLESEQYYTIRQLVPTKSLSPRGGGTPLCGARGYECRWNRVSFFVIESLYNSVKVGDKRSTCVVPTSFFPKKNIAGKIAS